MDPSEPASNPRYLVKLKKRGHHEKTHIGKLSSDHPDGHIMTRTWNPKFLNAYAGLCHVPPVQRRYLAYLHAIYVGSFSDAVVDELN